MTKTITWTVPLISCLFLLAFASMSGVARAQGSGDFFKGFKMMKIPRAEVPVGAVWQEGIGPNGIGASSEALQLSAAPSVMTSDRQFKLGAELSILQWLGLTGSLAGTTKINITDVQTLTVKDITALRTQPGNQVIYEAVKVGGFSVQTAVRRSPQLRRHWSSDRST